MKPGALLALTGGSGFIGRHFADAAKARGYRIRHLGRQRPAAAAEGDEFRSLDLSSLDPNASLLKGCDALVHLAAYIPRNHEDPAEAARCWNVNALGTLGLLEMAGRGDVAYVVQTSSANAYAPTSLSPDEGSALFPSSRGYYLGSKIMQEIYAEQYCRTTGLTLGTLRLGSVYGPGQESGALGNMVRAAQAGQPIQVIGSGRFGSDLVLVNDVVEALLLVLEGESSGPFNVGSGIRTSIAELARALTDLTGSPIHQDMSSGESDWGFPALNIERLKALGYRPTPIGTGLRAMLPCGGEIAPNA